LPFESSAGIGIIDLSYNFLMKNPVSVATVKNDSAETDPYPTI